VLTDTLDAGLTFQSVVGPTPFTPDTSGAPVLEFTLPAGTLPGTYTVSYTAEVNATAVGNVGNSVVAVGGGSNPPGCAPCSTTHPLGDPQVAVSKSANPASGTSVLHGQVITYTLT